MKRYYKSSFLQNRLVPSTRAGNRPKHRSNSIINSDDHSDSSSFDQSKCLEENKPLLNYFNQKSCEECRFSSDQANMYFCDKCDDGYHNYCIKINEQKLAQTWICPRCVKEEKEAKLLLQQKSFEIIQEDSPNCAICKKSLRIETQQEVYFGTQPQKIFFQFENEFEIQRCQVCKKLFHDQCFNMRSNAINCSNCQRSIRSRCPKGHQKFIQYYKNKYDVFKKEKYLTLKPLPSNVYPSANKRFQKMSFKLPSPVTNWLLITQYEASIYYAFQSKMLNFIEEQIYDSEKDMTLNRWDRDCVPILELHQDDERIFETFKENTTNGVIVGPYEIKEDRQKGFHIIATDFIEKMTLITEYVGEIVPARRSLFHHNQNDSVFMLIKNSSSSLSLDIVPNNFGNIARFFSGINNKNKESRKLLNVEAKRFSHKGRVRILFYARKDIQAGDQLYFDYNGSPFHEYPTENFKV